MAQIKFTINWEVQLSRNLRTLAVNIKNMWEFIKEAVEIVEDRSNEIFKSEWKNVEKNPKWAPLANSTQTARDKRYWYYKKAPNRPWTLRWTWRLQEDKTKRLLNNSWTLSYNAPYAVYHQDWWPNLPKRAIIDLSNATNEKIVKALQKKINKEIWIFGTQT